QGVGVHGRRRDGRARVDGRDLPRRPREARQPDLRRQLQPATPRRPGPRQREDHPGARDGLPRRGVERHQGHLGLALGPAPRLRPRRPAAPPDGGGRRRRLPDLQVALGRVRPRALLRRRARPRRPRQGHDRRRDLGAQPRRPRSPEGLRRLPRRRAPQGPADGDPRQDDQGLRHGRGRRGPEHHPPAEEDEREGALRLPRPVRALLVRRRSQGDQLPQARRRRRGDDLPARAARGARRLAARARPDGRLDDGARARGLQGPARGHGRARDLDDDGVRPDPRRVRARQEHRPARRADRARRVADVRHGGHVPPAGDLQPGRSAVPARGQRAAHVLPRGQGRPDPAGGDQRARRVLVLDRRRDRVRQPRDPDDPVLHLLLHVRLPARGRPRVGGRRLARPRVPPRRHRRADDAQRRGPAARGRALAHPVLAHPELRLLRPDLRLRGRGDHPGRPAPDGRRAGGRVLLHHADERELPAPLDAGGLERGDPPRAAPRPRGREGPPARQRHDPSRGRGGRDAARRRVRRRGRGVERDVVHRAAARGDGVRARGAAQGPAARVVGRAVPPRRHADRRRDRLHPRLRRPDPPVPRRAVHRARHRRLRPQRLPREAAPLLRGRPLPRRARRPARARRRGRRREGDQGVRHRRGCGGAVAEV
ncbi:MAG: Pyruvate dehydrogenase E1 component, partial [uncultured Solirubrobacteraceae bacterium]